MTTQSVIRDPLAELLKSAIAELIDSNVDGITEKITKNETGKLSVSFGAKLSLKGEQVAATVRLSYTEKHDDSVECRTPTGDRGCSVNSAEIRRGRPSASSMHRYATCPGSWLAEQCAGPDLSDKTDANHGTRIHSALAGKLDPAALTVEEYDTWERCKSQAEILTAEYITPDANGDTIKEERLWSVGEAFSGEPDLVVIGSRRALVIDYKTLLGDVAHAVGNLQLRTLAVLVWEKHDVDEVVVSIIQPLAGAPTVAIYTRADLEQAAAEIYGIVEQIKRPGNPRIPSGSACKYCLARTTCPEALAVAVAPPMEGIPAGTTPAAIAATLTAPTLGVFLERAQVADAVIEACREEAKRRIEFGAVIPGWILKPGAEKDTITNPQAVADRFFALGGTQEAFIGAVKVTKSGLKEAASALTGAKGKTLNQIVENLCDGAVETKQNRPSLARA